MIDRQTVFSSCRQYRYTLWREWDLFNSSYVMFIGLNPSTADETKDDPTIRRCIDFAKRWGYGAFCMTNLFAYRATDPLKMKAAQHSIGPDNDVWIERCAQDAGMVVAAWGTHGKFLDRDKDVLTLVDNIACLGLTQDGHPRHPLYIRKTAIPQAYGIAHSSLEG